MKWYGLKKLRWTNKIKNLKLRNKLQTRSLNINIKNKIGLNRFNFYFHIPPFWNLTIFHSFRTLNFFNNHLLLFFYSSIYFFYLPLPIFLNDFRFTENAKTLHFSLMFKNVFFSLYWVLFKNIFFSFSKIFFKKLKFKGKGYYVYKGIRNTVATQFGYSHMIRIFGFTISLKFVSKTVIFIYGINTIDILKMAKNIYVKRPQNIFTGKGVRFSKQIVYKKTGKISTYR